MSKFRIMPHGRLQEWVADEKGYFRDEGLEYEFVRWDLGRRELAPRVEEKPHMVMGGALEDMRDGRSCEVSSACHWCVGMAAASSPGRMWGGAYTVTPSGIYVPPESDIRRPEEIAASFYALKLDMRIDHIGLEALHELHTAVREAGGAAAAAGGMGVSEVVLRGITWDHVRGLAGLQATAAAYVASHPGVRVEWTTRSLQAFADRAHAR